MTTVENLAVVKRRTNALSSIWVEHGGLLVATLVLFVAAVVFAPNFLTYPNLINIARQMAFTGIIALGMTLVIVAAEIDISVGSAIAFGSSLFGVMVASFEIPLVLAAVLTLGIGTLIGLAAGTARAIIGIPSFIVTLALFSALRGGALLLTDAIPITIISDSFRWWGSGILLGLPVPTIIFIVLFIVFSVLAKATTFGRGVYAVGSNADAAHLSGLPVAWIRTVIFGLTGFLAALSGLLQTARLEAANSGYGNGVEFAVISAVIVGGASLFGGKGTMFGTVLGVFFIAVLSNAMILFGVNSYAQYVANGAVVLLAVMISTLRAKGA